MGAINIASKGVLYAKISSVVLLIALLTSCGGGGSTENQDAQIVTSSADLLIMSREIAEKKESFNTVEYQSNWGLDAINAKEAYAILALNNKNVAGAGVVVAVLDQSHIDISHTELEQNTSIDSGFIEQSDHATHIAGIIASSKDDNEIHGLAYDAEILSIATSQNSNLGFNKLVSSDVDIANLSWSLVNDNQAELALEFLTDTITNSEVLLVAAAGNNAEDNPVYPAQFAAKSNFYGRLIAVTSLDKDMKISGFSNKCGIAKNNCLAAPGSAIYSSVENNKYRNMSGTSMAAPHVSGAAAILKGAWSHLSSTQISEILLNSAIKVDEEGNLLAEQNEDYANEIYGRGILNLENALLARGGLTISSAQHINKKATGYDLASTRLELNSTFSELESLSSNLSDAIAIDKYGRDYALDLSSNISYRESHKIAEGLAIENTAKTQSFSFRGLSLNYKQQQVSDFKDLSFSLNKNFAKQKISLAFNKENNFNQESKDFSLIDFDKNTALSFASKSSAINPSFSFSRKLNDKFSLNNYINLYDFNRKTRNHNLGLGASYQHEGLNIRLSYGIVKEQENKLLNNKTSGAFAMQNDNMQHVEMSIKKFIGKIELQAQGFFAKSSVKAAKNSLISEVSDIYSRELKLGVAKKLNKTTKIGLFYKEPLKVTKGAINLNYASSIDSAGNISRKNKVVALNGAKTAKNLELYYAKELRKGNLNFNILYKEKGKKEPKEYGFLIKLTQDF